LVAIVPLRSQAKTVLLQDYLDVRSAGGGVVLGVGGILGSKVLARLPAGGTQYLLAKGAGVAGPVVVVWVCLDELPPEYLSVSGGNKGFCVENGPFRRCEAHLESEVGLSHQHEDTKSSKPR